MKCSFFNSTPFDLDKVNQSKDGVLVTKRLEGIKNCSH